MKLKPLTELEKFVWSNQNRSFEFLASQTNRPLYQIELAYDRAKRKNEQIDTCLNKLII